MASIFVLKDEIYQIRNFSRDKVRVLMRLDANKVDLTNRRVHRKDRDLAVTWARMCGKGRVFTRRSGTPGGTRISGNAGHVGRGDQVGDEAGGRRRHTTSSVVARSS